MPHIEIAEVQTSVFIILIIIVGIVISFVAFMSIRAAKKAAVNVQKVFEGQYEPTSFFGVRETIRTDDDLILPTIAGGGNKINRILGISSGLWIPFVMFFGWLAALLAEFLTGGVHTVWHLFFHAVW